MRAGTRRAAALILKPLLFEVAEVVPSLNRLLRMHWTQRRRLIQRWSWLVLGAVRGRDTLPVGQFVGRVRIRVIRRSHHTLDDDNLAGSAKVILDALKRIGVIEDDSPAHVQLVCEQERGTEFTTVWIHPLTQE